MSKSAEFIFKESQKEFAKYAYCTHQDIYSISLPTINKIDNIDVKCKLVVNKIPTNLKKKYFIGFWIESSKINYTGRRGEYNLYNYKEKLYPYKKETVEKFLQKVKNDILPKLKLDKVFGKLFLNNTDGTKSIQKENVGEDIFGFEYSNYEKCSVCYEHTYTRTSCSHSLCFDCWNKIKNGSCPLCRSELKMSFDENNDICDEDDNEALNTAFIIDNGNDEVEDEEYGEYF